MEVSQVSIRISLNAVNEEDELSVSVATWEDYQQMAAISSEQDNVESVVVELALYRDGESVQPSGDTRVCFETSEDTENLCLAFVNAAGLWEAEDCDIFVKDRRLCGVTSQFGVFALVEKSSVAQPNSPAASVPPQDPQDAPYYAVFNTFTYFVRSYQETLTIDQGEGNNVVTLNPEESYESLDSETDSSTASSFTLSMVVVFFFAVLL